MGVSGERAQHAPTGFLVAFGLAVGLNDLEELVTSHGSKSLFTKQAYAWHWNLPAIAAFSGSRPQLPRRIIMAERLVDCFV